MINTQIKQRIVSELEKQVPNYGSRAKLANSLSINKAQMSRVMNGELNVLSDAKWISIARKFDVELRESARWNTAKTPVFNHVYSQLTACQDNSLSALLCDVADIGKTYTAKVYVKEHRNAVYIDCSQYKTRQQLIRAMAKEFGLTNTGRYVDVYQDLVFYLKSIDTPIIILDEAGDLSYPAFLELKALWNATERACGWYMMGADGLRAKINRNISFQKVGYTEIFSRFGNRYQKVTPDGKEERDEFTKTQVAIIAKANGVTDVKSIYAKTGGSLRRIYTEIQKLIRLQLNSNQ